MIFKDTTPNELEAVAACHIAAFPNSFSSKLGTKYVAKMLGWYLSTDKAFMFHLQEADRVLGYCGAIISDGTLATGAASGMTQFSFNDAVKAILIRPWLAFHPEVRKRYVFILKNILTKIGLRNPANSKVQKEKQHKVPQIGLVVIGVHPAAQGKGYGSKILKEFEKKAATYGIEKLQLTVKPTNHQAIKAYERNGWQTEQIEPSSQVMFKMLQSKDTIASKTNTNS